MIDWLHHFSQDLPAAVLPGSRQVTLDNESYSWSTEEEIPLRDGPGTCRLGNPKNRTLFVLNYESYLNKCLKKIKDKRCDYMVFSKKEQGTALLIELTSGKDPEVLNKNTSNEKFLPTREKKQLQLLESLRLLKRDKGCTWKDISSMQQRVCILSFTLTLDLPPQEAPARSYQTFMQPLIAERQAPIVGDVVPSGTQAEYPGRVVEEIRELSFEYFEMISTGEPFQIL